MDLNEAIRTRRSQHYLVPPAPDDEQFIELLQTASAAPDHGQLRPWRWVLIRGDQRAALGEALALTEPPARRAAAAAKPLRAPLLATVVFAPRRDVTVPEWEQLAATAAMVHSLELVLHGHGWGSIWRTGPKTASEAAHALLRVTPDERLLGWLYIGTPDHRSRLAPATRSTSAPASPASPPGGLLVEDDQNHSQCRTPRLGIGRSATPPAAASASTCGYRVRSGPARATTPGSPRTRTAP